MGLFVFERGSLFPRRSVREVARNPQAGSTHPRRFSRTERNTPFIVNENCFIESHTLRFICVMKTPPPIHEPGHHEKTNGRRSQTKTDPPEIRRT